MAFLSPFLHRKRFPSIRFHLSTSIRDSLMQLNSVDGTVPSLSSVPRTTFFSHFSTYLCPYVKHYKAFPSCVYPPSSCFSISRSYIYKYRSVLLKWQHCSFTSNALVTLKADNDVVRFCLDKPAVEREGRTKGKNTQKRKKMSKKAKVNELRFYRLKAKKKMTSPNPEVRIRYKLEKAKRKEEWLIEKLRKFEVPKAPEEIYDPEILTEEELFFLKRTGEKKKNYVPVGRRGVFGGVVLNMHLHWKRHETVKVVCKPCRPGQVHEYAEELARLSKGIAIDIKANNVIIFYRGKNYVQPEVMSPPDTLSKSKALEKYKFEQSLEHTSEFIEKLEKELEDYHRHIALYRKGKEAAAENPTTNI
ncbi:uncharacterized CRM domain-containing protein At3g25440, chloroplastic-like isoform X1 [Magnolia sinica]|uniref:uncharacterized CRM domain-containing protein At3g25440, chloroplastic-like isoform X1 n=1 Tax=Magnolia sinica TaxID=86752 RepID=UPI0026590A36|nr:uncharacterized CRM domain-containing protein At3g25440, chloroplastic-like isoform X1 [Magnolia sinica]